MNKAILVGRLTRDPELKTTQSGVNVTSFTLAVDRRFKKDEADFINCVAWRQTAEFICKYFTKGKMLGVIGSIQTRSWEDSDGKKQYTTEVIVDEAYFTGEKRPSASSQSQSIGDTPINQTLPEGDFMPGESDDDLPF